MKFSVLMSVYINDSYDFFKQAFESIINQTKIPNEIVIVKDGPIKEEINQYLSNIRLNGINLKVINFEKNVGLGVALAKGLNCCENDLVARMDSDDISLNNRFEKQISLFEKDKELAIVGGFIKEFYESIDNVIGVRTVPLNSKQIQKYMRFRSPFNHVSVMFRKTEIIKSGNYQDYKLNEDYYLWVRLMKRHVKACNIKDILVLVRMNSSSYKRKSGDRKSVV
jgi:glycosyltransferase involved in cell wall biosynthesis